MLDTARDNCLHEMRGESRQRNKAQGQRRFMKHVSIQRKQMGRTTENGKELEGHGVQVYQRWGGGILFGASYHVGLAVYLWVCRKQKQRRLRPPAPGRPQAARLRGGRHENEEAPRTTAEGPVTAAGLLPEAGPRRAHMGRCPSRQRAASGRRSGPARVRGPSRGHAACRCRPDRSSALRSGAQATRRPLWGAGTTLSGRKPTKLSSSAEIHVLQYIFNMMNLGPF